MFQTRREYALKMSQLIWQDIDSRIHESGLYDEIRLLNPSLTTEEFEAILVEGITAFFWIKDDAVALDLCRRWVGDDPKLEESIMIKRFIFILFQDDEAIRRHFRDFKVV